VSTPSTQSTPNQHKHHKHEYEQEGQDQILLTGQSYRNFIEAVHSPFSRIIYANYLKLYMQYRKIDDCEQLLRGDLRLIQAQLIDYTIHLREELKLSASTINSRLSAIKKFYDNNDIELKWKRSEQQCSRRTTRALTENGFCLSRLL
jgi:hypothetical protein